jgi:hypothetical protein
VPRIKRISVIRFHTRRKAEPTFTIRLIPQTSLRFLRKLEHARYGRGADLECGRADARGSRNNSRCRLGVRVGITAWTAAERRPISFTGFVLLSYFGFPCVLAYRDGRYCSAPKPGKEKQKSYNYCSAVLMVHRFRSFLSVFTQVMRKIRREVRRKLAASLKHCCLRQG